MSARMKLQGEFCAAGAAFATDAEIVERVAAQQYSFGYVGYNSDVRARGPPSRCQRFTHLPVPSICSSNRTSRGCLMKCPVRLVWAGCKHCGQVSVAVHSDNITRIRQGGRSLSCVYPGVQHFSLVALPCTIIQAFAEHRVFVCERVCVRVSARALVHVTAECGGCRPRFGRTSRL
jgi:hypothetical protein